jgi:enoyl-CoA hydratase/carnithine racemase
MPDISIDNHILTIQFNRPEAKNALNPQVVGTLISTLREQANNPKVRVAIITGTGPVFSAGMDVNVFKHAHDPENAALLNYQVRDMFDAIIDFPKPIIGAANGLGVGFGFTVLGLCDIVIMAESAKFSLPFASLGACPEGCSTFTLPHLLGWQKASWLLYSGDWITAQECKTVGLALEVVPDEELHHTAKHCANKLAAKSLTSLMVTKKTLMASRKSALFEANRLEMNDFVKLIVHPACKEGVSAFFEKRQPDFISQDL